MRLIPPGVRLRWEDNDWWTQELLLAFSAGRDTEEANLAAVLASRGM
jgi:hypothetical protein